MRLRKCAVICFLGFMAVIGLVRKFNNAGSSTVIIIDDANLLHRYNLVTDWETINHKECSLSYINANKLPQDHPCVIEIIRRHYLRDPTPPDVPYHLDNPKANVNFEIDPDSYSESVIAPYVLSLFKNKTGGFFIECGAADGELLSNTLLMERSLKWTGLLIEANPHNYKKLLKRNRKAWTLPICLSLEPYPTEVLFTSVADGAGASQTHIVEVDPLTGKEFQDQWDRPNADKVAAQCFPLYSVLLAANRTRIDYLSLDIEGHELRVLHTIPWHRVDIKVLTVEWLRIRGGGDLGPEVNRFMEENGYLRTSTIEAKGQTFDSVFIKDLLNT